MPEQPVTSSATSVPFETDSLAAAHERIAEMEQQAALQGLIRTTLAREASLNRSLASFHKENARQLEYEANHDSLTGLLNRRGLEAFMEAAPNLQDYAVIYADGDNFKAINEILGHDRGDEMLVKTAGALRRSLRKESIIARVGGDEFMMLIYTGPQGNNQRHADATPLDQAENVRERINAEMVHVITDNSDTELLGFGLTTGIAFPTETSTIDELKEQAEAEMRERKKLKTIHHRPIPELTQTPPDELE